MAYPVCIHATALHATVSGSDLSIFEPRVRSCWDRYIQASSQFQTCSNPPLPEVEPPFAAWPVRATGRSSSPVASADAGAIWGSCSPLWPRPSSWDRWFETRTGRRVLLSEYQGKSCAGSRMHHRRSGSVTISIANSGAVFWSEHDMPRKGGEWRDLTKIGIASCYIGVD